MKPLREMSVVLGLMLAAGLAQGQIAPPPPAPPVANPPYAPTAPTAPPAPAAPKPRASPAQQEAAQAAEDQKKAAEVRFESIAVLDENGNIKPLPEPVEWYALKHNPVVKPIRLAMCEEAMRERRARIERLIIDNIDLITRLDSGLLDALDMTDKSRIAEIVQLVKPFQSQGTLTSELKKKKLLEGVQAAVNTRMVTEYTNKKTSVERVKAGLTAKADRADPKPDPGDPAAATAVDVMARVMLQMGLDESTVFYRQLLLETGPRLEKLGVDAADVKRFTDAQTEQDKLVAVKRALEPLALDQQRDLLRRSLELRPPPPPLPDIEKMKSESVAASGVVAWKGPSALVEKRILLNTAISKVKATTAKLATLTEAASKPDATEADKKALADAQASLETDKAAESAAREAVLAAVKENPEYKKYLSDNMAKAHGTYFEPEAKPQAKPEAKPEAKPGDTDKK